MEAQIIERNEEEFYTVAAKFRQIIDEYIENMEEIFISLKEANKRFGVGDDGSTTN